ncbi:MAG: OmpA family protein [Pseudomonadota bacterium]|nr:OmpA family protein [Pseudomonadota bacterium]
MNANKVLHFSLAMLLVGASSQAYAQAQTPPQEPLKNPSVDSIIEGLKTDAPAQDAGATRALRPGAAAAATAPATAPVASPVSKPVRPASVSLQINFDFNSDRISTSSGRTMESLVKALSNDQLRDRNFTIVGHTDGVGSAGYNQALSERRAASVKRWLVENGVDSARLHTQGRGKSQLINARDPSAAENRRVEIQASGG